MLRFSFLPLLLCIVAHLHAAEPPTPVKIVALGDSITKGYRPGVKVEETFPYLLQDALKKEGVAVEVVNVGVGGENTAQALVRLKKAVVDLKPQLVTIMYGANDSYVDKGKQDARLTPDQFQENLKKLVEELRKEGIQPILMTSPRLGDKHPPNGAGEHPGKRLEEYMKITRKVAETTKIPLIDHYTHWDKKNSGGTDIGEWTTDQCHPNLRGHQEIVATMFPVIRKSLERK